MRKVLVGIVVAGALGSAAPSGAAPSVVREEMLQGAAGEAVLGQGYSLATNELGGSCLANVVATTPSYNFVHVVLPFDQDGLATLASRGHRMSQLAADLGRRHAAAAGVTAIHTHRLIVVLDVDAYYSSVDETAARLSAPAAALLGQNDLVGFFETCGAYYVRSISRRMAMVAVFSYETPSDVPDPAHVEWVTRQVKCAASKASCDAAAPAGVTLRTMELHRLLDRAPPTVETTAFDRHAFRAAVQHTVRSAQAAGAGYPTAIEVVPWLENPELQKVALLPQGDGSVASYQQKRILLVNAELLAEIRRAARAKRQAFETAQRCRTIGEDELERVRLELETFVNGGTAAAVPAIEDVNARVKLIREILLGRRTDLGYPANLFPGANACVAALRSAGLSLRSYRTIAACARLEETFAVVAGHRAYAICGAPEDAPARVSP